MVRLIVVSGFTLTTEVKAAKNKICNTTLNLFKVKDALGLKIHTSTGSFKELCLISNFSELCFFFLSKMEPSVVSEHAAECLVTVKCAKV